MAAHNRTSSLPVLTPRAAAQSPDLKLPLTEDIPKEKCGVVGVWNHRDAVHKVYMGLYAQQHRGQESAGIAVSDGAAIHGHNGMGLVSDVFTARDLADLGARLTRVGEERPDEQPAVGGAIGHNRCSTAGEPGEIVTLDHHGVTSRRFAPQAERLARCVFEHVYFASPASNVFGQNVLVSRERFGEALAREAPADADLVMPMPDSGRSAANGFARASGLPYCEGIVPNRYVGRTFIKPTQGERRDAVRLKLNVVSEIVDGQRVVVVDDSIVRGTTTREKMSQLRDAGAKEIHLRISCPPIRHPCYFGVDFATRDQLIAHNREIEQIREFLGVDSLGFLSHDGMLEAMNHPPESYCTACFSGDYRIDIKHPVTERVLERSQMTF